MFTVAEVIFFAFICSIVNASSIPNPPTIVKLSYGSFQGAKGVNITKFLGIPFAQAPLNNLRFAPPRPPLQLIGVKNTTAFGPACPQQDVNVPDVLPFTITSNTPPPSNISEDCLHINVWVPNVPAGSSPLPVLMWIYGGGFESGYTSAYDASDLVERSLVLRQPLIVVSANYRVNAFGFLGGREVQQAGLGNVGLQDQRFAMKWIQTYISAFGGDPKKVTIWGESAGAISVGLHLVYQDGETSGLFRAAFMESGAPWTTEPLAAGQPVYDHLVANTGCSHHQDTLTCLRGVSFNTLVAAVKSTPTVFNFTSLNARFPPRTDGVLIRRNAQRSVSLGKYAKVPIVSGNCADEGTVFSLGSTNVTTNTEFLEYIHSNYLPLACENDIQTVGSAYPADPNQGSPFGTGGNNTLTPEFKRISAFTGDYAFQAPRRHLLQVASQTQPAWSYLYERGRSTPFLGTFHASDLTEFFSFGGTSAGNDFIGSDALVNFAVNLDPNFPSKSTPGGVSSLQGVKWVKYSSSGSPSMLAFTDPAPSLDFISDTYRLAPMQLLTTLALLTP